MGDYKKSFLNSISWNVVANVAVFFLGLAQIFILVQYLSKVDFGVYATASVVLSFFLLYIDVGLSNAIIFKEVFEKNELTNLFLLNIGISICLTILFYFSAISLASWYEEPSLVSIIKALSIIILLSGIAVIFKTLLNKHLQFKYLSIVHVLSTLAYFLVSAFSATEGKGVWSLVYGALAREFVEGALYVFFGWKYFKWDLKWGIIDKVLYRKYFGFQLGERTFNYMAQNMDILIIGKVMGQEALGVYDVFKRLLFRFYRQLNPMITNVSFPYMVKINKNLNLLKQVYQKKWFGLILVNSGSYMAAIFISKMVIQMVFGGDWLTHQNEFILIAILGWMMSTGQPVGTLILATGRVEIGFYWNIFTAIGTAIVLLVSSAYGLQNMLLSVIFWQLILGVCNYIFQIKPLIPYDFIEYLGDLLIPVGCGVLAGIVAYWLSSFIDNDIVFISTYVFTYLISYSVLIWWLFKKRIIDYKDDIVQWIK